MAISAGVKGSGPVPPRVDAPVFGIGTNAPGSVGRVNVADPGIALYSVEVKYRLRYPNCPP